MATIPDCQIQVAFYSTSRKVLHQFIGKTGHIKYNVNLPVNKPFVSIRVVTSRYDEKKLEFIPKNPCLQN